MNSKKIRHKLGVCILMLLISVSSVSARNVIKNLPGFDNDPLNFGFTLGISYMNFSSGSTGLPSPSDGNIWYSDVSSPTPGFHVGIISSFRLHRFFNLRLVPTISLGQRNLRFVRFEESGDGEVTQIEREDGAVPVKSTFIEVPMLIKYKALRDGNARPYLIGGINPRYDLARSKKDDILLKPFDLYFEIGVGSDFYLQFFRFGVEAKFSVGLNDILDRSRTVANSNRYQPQYTESIDRLTSRLFIISFNFE